MNLADLPLPELGVHLPSAGTRSCLLLAFIHLAILATLGLKRPHCQGNENYLLQGVPSSERSTSVCMLVQVQIDTQQATLFCVHFLVSFLRVASPDIQKWLHAKGSYVRACIQMIAAGSLWRLSF